MKHFLALIAFFTIVSAGFAQQYPFSEGFETTFSGSIPDSFPGDIPVLGYHGTNDQKGLAALVHGGDPVDTCVSPLIGPLTGNSALVFFYRWVIDNIYPSIPKAASKNDRLEVLASTDGTNYSLVHLIDSAAHKTSLNFKRVEVPLTSFAGQNVRLKFRCVRGSDRYFMDIDSIRVIDLMGVGIEESVFANKNLHVYPNPAQEYVTVDFEQSSTETILTITDLAGRTIQEQDFMVSTTVSTANWARGIYLVAVSDSAGRKAVRRLVKQ